MKTKNFLHQKEKKIIMVLKRATIPAKMVAVRRMPTVSKKTFPNVFGQPRNHH